MSQNSILIVENQLLDGTELNQDLNTIQQGCHRTGRILRKIRQYTSEQTRGTRLFQGTDPVGNSLVVGDGTTHRREDE